MPATKHNELVTNADQIPDIIREAFHLASTGRKGPVLVDIPKDVLAELRRVSEEVLDEEAQRTRVAIFVSKTDHCLYDLLLRHRAGELVCDIPLIVSNHPDLERVAEQFDHPAQRMAEYIQALLFQFLEGVEIKATETPF